MKNDKKDNSEQQNKFNFVLFIWHQITTIVTLQSKVEGRGKDPTN